MVFAVIICINLKSSRKGVNMDYWQYLSKDHPKWLREATVEEKAAYVALHREYAKRRCREGHGVTVCAECGQFFQCM